MGTSLADKLSLPGPVDDTPGPAWSRVEAPGRPAGLELQRRVSAPLPAPSAIDDDLVRGRIIHQFANHELLALELMALVLLRFPDAPRALRRTLVATMCDEQRHMRLYLGRMKTLGVQLGEVPVNAFFWDCLSGVSDPLAFIAGMSLGFEQANLDYAVHWMRAFEQVGDSETVDVLARVHADEIRHVAHGVHWLRELKDPDLDDWTAWTGALEAPMTPRRARGPAFQHDARLQAGMHEDFVQRVRSAGQSRGRPPRVYWFNPWVEDEIAGHAEPGRVLRDLAADLAPCMRFLASEDDVVVVPRLPSPAFVADQAQRGATVLELVEGSVPTPALLGDRPVHSLHPWGWSTSTIRAVQQVQPQLQHPPKWKASHAVLSRKDHAANVLRALPADPRVDIEGGVVVRALEDLDRAVATWQECLIKAPLSASGRHRIRVPGPRAEHTRDWVTRQLRTQGSVVVEPWRQRLVDLSLHATVRESGLRVDGITRFFTDASGQFRGVMLDRWTRGLPSDLLRWVHQEAGWVDESLRQAAVAAVAGAPGLHGPISVDAFIWRGPETPVLRPLVELNPRPTFSRLGLGVQRQLVAPRASAAWLVADLRSVRRAGFQDLGHFVKVLQESMPARGIPLTEGALPTSDPTRCTRMLTVLVAAPTWRELQERWGSFAHGRDGLRDWLGAIGGHGQENE